MVREAQVSVNKRIDCISLSLTQKPPSDCFVHSEEFHRFPLQNVLLAMTSVLSRNKETMTIFRFHFQGLLHALSIAHEKTKHKQTKKQIQKQTKNPSDFIVNKVFHMFSPRDLCHAAI